MTSVEPVTSTSYTAYQVTPENAVQVTTVLLPELASLGYKVVVTTFLVTTGVLSWTLTIQRAGSQDKTANSGDWVVISSVGNASVVAQSDYASTYQSVT